MLIHWIWLAQLPGVSLRQKAALLQRFSDPEDLFNATRPELEGMALTSDTVQALLNKALTEAEGIVAQCTQKRIGILTYRDTGYPSRLRSLADAPAVLYYLGMLPDLDAQPVISVVGTRKATPYGIKAAGHISRQLTACGGLVISGGAAGVDAAAMEGALEAGGQTLGVLGCGVDVAYPATNRDLFARVAQKGCLISEYPPGTRPERWHFPQRNRILSGISHGVLVIEAPENSGALITARDALEQGRDVFAVPGNIDSDTCAGSNALLRDGAVPVLCGRDILREYEGRFSCVQKRVLPPRQEEAAPVKAEPIKPSGDKKAIDKPSKTPYSGMADLSEEEWAVVSCLSAVPVPVDQVIAQLGLPAAAVLRTVTMLCMKGVVTQHPGRCLSVGS